MLCFNEIIIAEVIPCCDIVCESSLIKYRLVHHVFLGSAKILDLRTLILDTWGIHHLEIESLWMPILTEA